MKKYLVIMGVLALTAMPLNAQESYQAPTLDSHPDAGQLVGMKWNYQSVDGKPYLAFEVPETDNTLWRFACEEYRDGRHVIGNTLLSRPKNAKANDRLGFTIRVDNGNSFGIVARMDKTQVEGDDYHFPYFRLLKGHSLWNSLKRGQRAYIDLGGRQFSVHLNGSGDAIKSFLAACGGKTKTD